MGAPDIHSARRRFSDGRKEWRGSVPGARPRTAVAGLALLLCTALGGCRPDDPTARHEHPVPLGAFLGSDEGGVGRIPAFQRWLDTPVTVGHTYLPGESWSGIEGPDYIVEPWARWKAEDPGRLLVLNVPMLEANEAGVPDRTVAALLGRGAEGAFDGHYTRLARRLAGAGVKDIVIVLGWEMNGLTYTGRCGPAPDRWKAYWRRIVAAMRAVPGIRFSFDFTATRGPDAVPWPECYPGDDVVDIVGLDAYDQPSGKRFDYYRDEPYGLKYHAEFAAAHHKPMSFPEWGLFDNADNPDYIKGMHDWIEGHDVVYQTITDYCPHGIWRCTRNERSSSAYRSLFGGRGLQTAPPPVTVPAGGTTAPASPSASPSSAAPSGSPSEPPASLAVPPPVARPESPAASPDAPSSALVPQSASMPPPASPSAPASALASPPVPPLAASPDASAATLEPSPPASPPAAPDATPSASPSPSPSAAPSAPASPAAPPAQSAPPAQLVPPPAPASPPVAPAP
ncbi:glycoside hydrolase family 26 protein, partial [Actinomadura parmotrematis]